MTYQVEMIRFSEKHGDYYILATTKEIRDIGCLQVLTNRWNEGHWYYDTSEELAKAEDAVERLTDEMIDSLPETLQADVRRTKQRAEADLKYYQKQAKFYEAAKLVVEEQNASLAYRVLAARSDHEYEGFYSEWIQVPDAVSVTVELNPALLNRG